MGGGSDTIRLFIPDTIDTRLFQLNFRYLILNTKTLIHLVHIPGMSDDLVGGKT